MKYTKVAKLTLIAVTVAVLGCHRSKNKQPASSTQPVSSSATDLKNPQVLQHEVVDGSHQPWRFDPLSTAEAALIRAMKQPLDPSIYDDKRWTLKKIKGGYQAIWHGPYKDVYANASVTVKPMQGAPAFWEATKVELPLSRSNL